MKVPDFLHLILDFILIPSSIVVAAVSGPFLLFTRWIYYLLRTVFPEKVTGKVVIVTGASGGIGEAIAYEYAKQGAQLVLSGRNEDILKTVARDANYLGAARTHVIAGDLSNPDDSKRLIDETLDRFGRLDHLSLNTGLGQNFYVEEAVGKDGTKYKPIVDANFWANVLPLHYAIHHLKKNNGRVVVTTGSSAFIPYPKQSIYNAAKGALLNFYDTIRVEAGPSLGVTIALPGWIDNEYSRGLHVTANGEIKSRDEARPKRGLIPLEEAETAAKRIVCGALKDYRYVFTPYWVVALLYWRVFAADFVEALLRLGVMAAPKLEEVKKKTEKGLYKAYEQASEQYGKVAEQSRSLFPLQPKPEKQQAGGGEKKE